MQDALAGVRLSLQDHYAVRVAHRVRNTTRLNERARSARLLFEMAKWLATGREVKGESLLRLVGGRWVLSSTR